MNKSLKVVVSLALSLACFLVFFGNVYAASTTCIDITGQTTRLVPPNSDLISFDQDGGQPPTAMEACISNVATSRFVHASGVTAYPVEGYAWDENAGWLQFDWSFGTEKSQAGVDEDGYLYGYIWNDNIGWIQLDWWDDATSYPLGKETVGVPRIDFAVGPPFSIVGFAWNDRLGWFNLSGAKTNWQPPRCILAEGDCLPVPAKNMCKETFMLPYLSYETDLIAMDTFSVQIINRPYNLCQPTISWGSTDAGAKFNGSLQIYTNTTKKVVYEPSNATQAKISISLTDGVITLNQDLQLKPLFQHKCGGLPVDYLPECNPPNSNYCDADCYIKNDPDLKFCGNRKVEVIEGEECDAGFYGGYLDKTSWCTSSCKIEDKPTVIKKIQLKTPFEEIDNIPPANPLSHSYGPCFCLEDVNGNCVEVDGSKVTKINMQIDYDNTMLFDQGLLNSVKVNDGTEGNHLGAFGEAAPVFLYENNKTTNKTSPTVVGATNIGKYTVNIDLTSGSDGLACLDVRSYSPTSGV
ncbi:hypothetical protein KKG71_04415, partial [Patescibacteria group bacterium]|nr:hypothetical protein [Patescibacteria group bacterium]